MKNIHPKISISLKSLIEEEFVKALEDVRSFNSHCEYLLRKSVLLDLRFYATLSAGGLPAK